MKIRYFSLILLMTCSFRRLGFRVATFVLLAFVALPAVVFAEDSLYWNTNTSRITADISSTDFFRVLQGVSAATGWKVYVEPETAHKVSSKFKDLPPGEALHLLLGNVNFAFIPETSGRPRLYVFRTSAGHATQLMAPQKLGAAAEVVAKKMPGELIVRLKPGAKIDDIARALGAKVIGQIGGVNAYRLKFDDQSAADAARNQLSSNSDVASVEDNYQIDRPMTPREAPIAGPPTPHLEVKPPSGTDRIIVAAVDTAYQRSGSGEDAFVLKQMYVAGDPTLDPNTPSHGTTVVDTILQSLAAASPKGSTSVQILPVDIYGPNSSTTSFDAAQGITTAINNGAKIVNMSFGGVGQSGVMQDVIDQGTSKGIIFIAAAGNDGSTEKFYPAAFPGVLAVTALDNGQLASYANRGDFVSLAAPGTSLVNFNGRTFYVAGTSEAAPRVAGALAGYMDSTHSTAAQSQGFLGVNFPLPK